MKGKIVCPAVDIEGMVDFVKRLQILGARPFYFATVVVDAAVLFRRPQELLYLVYTEEAVVVRPSHDLEIGIEDIV